MKYITNFFRVGCAALLAVLILAPGAFAQQITTADPPVVTAAVGDPTEANPQQGRITLTWDAVLEANNGGSPILAGADGYRIEVTEDPTDETSWVVVPSGEITVTPPTDPATEFTAVHALPADDNG